MTRRLMSQKTPLTLMDSPSNGLVHQYGSPVMKSINPCTVKAVPCLKENAKWVSPDVDFGNSNKLRKDSISIETKRNMKSENRTKMRKASTSENSGTNSPSFVPKSRKNSYSKLEFVNKHDGNYSYRNKDENKENIRPGSKLSSPAEPKPNKTENTYRQRKYLSGNSSRLNFI